VTGRSASLLPGDKLEDITLERALKLLSLPRLVGQFEGEEVWAHNGKFGPYIKAGKDSRSLTNHEELFTLSEEQAEAILRQPKLRGRAQPKPAVQTFEFEDRKPIELRDGRFGLYLTDGEMNAWLRANDNPDNLDADRARDIFNERAKPPKGKPAKAAGTKKAASSKTSGAKTAGTKASPRVKGTKPKAKTSKTRAGSKTAKPAKAPSEKPLWTDLEPFAATFDPTTAQLLKLVNGEGVKMADAATRLRITSEDAMSRYRASNFKLYSLYRKARATATP
jgi:DNA topoisomerase I